MNENNYQFNIFQWKLAQTASIENYHALLDFFFNINIANYLLKNNNKVKEILSKKGLKSCIYYNNIKDLRSSHIINVVKMSEKIGLHIGTKKDEMTMLIQGATLHDYGKILIPSSLLQKKDKLNKYEKEVVALHSELGYQLLRPLNFDKRVINMVKNHHLCAKDNKDILGQIITISDIYSALTEHRVYKSVYSKKEALQKLKAYANSGLVNNDLLIALCEIEHIAENEIKVA